jgi:serine/threonine protein kinase
MFAQMCEAVATCHDASVFHRDIKPENFIVTDGWTLNHDGVPERKVVVKLSDFGLSTRDAVSSDMDCGSAPYMSFGVPFFFSFDLLSLILTFPGAECRNNVAPVYKPRAADVWSLGIVLINMYVPDIVLPLRLASFLLRLSGSSLIRVLAGFTIAIRGWTLSRMAAPLFLNISPPRRTFLCSDLPV